MSKGSRIHDLLQLAQDKTSEARHILTENITDLFLSEGGRLSEHERALMSDILSKLVNQVEKNIKVELSKALARSGVEMPDIVKLLANDEIEIARPLLEKSALLKDPDLVEIIRMRTDEHRLAISMRENVSESVSNALIEYGGDDVIESLLNNHDAQLSKRAMEYLVIESRRVDRFQEPVIMRGDLPGDLAYKMYWWVSAALRKHIITSFEIDPVQVERAIKRATGAAMIDTEQEQSAHVRAQQLVRRMAENNELTVQFLVNALRQQRIAVFVAGIAELAGINFRTAWRIFSDRGGESLAVLAKAVGIDRQSFTNIFLLVLEARDGGKAKAPGILQKIIKIYEDISDSNAKNALQIWQRDGAYQDAIEELERVG